MSKLHIKKGDTVYVNTGNCKGQTGKVLQVLVKEQRAIVEGVNMVSKSQKPSAKYPQGGGGQGNYRNGKSRYRRC